MVKDEKIKDQVLLKTVVGVPNFSQQTTSMYCLCLRMFPPLNNHEI